MPDSVLPVFTSIDGFHEEGAIIGRLVVGYGELEGEMAICIGHATKNPDFAIRALFKDRGELPRIKLARKYLSTPARCAKLQRETAAALSDMNYCRQIRNQYAHCQWFPVSGQLAFVNLEEVAAGPVVPIQSYRRCLDLPLLQHQERFFVYVRRSFHQLEEEFRNWANGLTIRVFPMPPKVAQPPLHNP